MKRTIPHTDDRRIVIETSSGVGPFLLGVLAGAVGALLIAPRSGEETRRMIGGRVDRVKSRVDRERERVLDAVAAGRDAAESTRGDLRRKIDAAKQSFRTERDTAMRVATARAEAARQAMGESPRATSRDMMRDATRQTPGGGSSDA